MVMVASPLIAKAIMTVAEGFAQQNYRHPYLTACVGNTDLTAISGYVATHWCMLI